MSTPQNFENGSWNVVCDVCGREYRSYLLTKRWDGLMVCQGDWEPRQPQDFVRGVADIMAPPYTRPEADESFIVPNKPYMCTFTGMRSIAGYAVAGCVVAGSP